MKRIISLFVAAAFVLSLGTAFASAAGALPDVRPEAEVAVRDDYLLGVPAGATAADVKSYFTDAVTVCDNFGAPQDDAAIALLRVLVGIQIQQRIRFRQRFQYSFRIHGLLSLVSPAFSRSQVPDRQVFSAAISVSVMPAPVRYAEAALS